MALIARSPPRRMTARAVAPIVGFALWLGATAGLLTALSYHSARPGVAAEASIVWPAASKLPRVTGRAALVMIAHPHCPCTRASLRELERAMARSGGRIDAFVAFIGPVEGVQSPDLLDLRATARAIPGVRVVEDANEARLFGARTSGQTYLYDAAGALVFQGGMTSARGHEGASVASETIHRFVSGSADAAASTAPSADVFGCGLFDPEPATGVASAEDRLP